MIMWDFIDLPLQEFLLVTLSWTLSFHLSHPDKGRTIERIRGGEKSHLWFTTEIIERNCNTKELKYAFISLYQKIWTNYFYDEIKLNNTYHRIKHFYMLLYNCSLFVPSSTNTAQRESVANKGTSKKKKNKQQQNTQKTQETKENIFTLLNKQSNHSFLTWQSHFIFLPPIACSV